MAEVKWIKLYTDVFDNRKIKQIEYMPESDALINIWFRLLCLCGKVNDNGLIYLTPEVPYTEEMLAKEFNKDITVIRLALSVFEKFGMLEIIDDIYCISNWEKYQNIEGMEKIKEQTRLRVANYRERKRLECNVTLPVTLRNATDIDIEEDKNKKEKKNNKRFIVPTLEEVDTYIRENQFNVDASKFIDYYNSNGWKVGKNSMKDWKATVRNWNRNTNENNKVEDRPSSGWDFSMFEAGGKKHD